MLALGAPPPSYHQPSYSLICVEEPASPCLPRGSVVLISGNNRTRRSLLNQRAVVRRAVGLGGWHHVLLADGSEVKLQRNALTVIEFGPGDGVETDGTPSHGSSSADTESREPQIDLLTQPRVRRPPKATTELPLFKRVAACHSSELRASSYPLVNLHKLDTVSLKRYRRVFQLAQVDAAAHKEELVDAVQQHFTTQEVEEATVLLEFVSTVQRRFRRQQLTLQQYNGYAAAAADLQLHEEEEGQQQQTHLLHYHHHNHHQLQPRVCLFK